MRSAASSVAGLIFIIVSFIIRWAGREWLNVVLPPAAMGVIVALIGLGLASVATDMAFSSGEKFGAHYSAGVATAISLVTLAVVVFGSLLFRGFLAALPVLMGVIVGYVLAAIINYLGSRHGQLRRRHVGARLRHAQARLPGLSTWPRS